MYLSETEIYKKFFTAVKKVIENPPKSDPDDIFGEDCSTMICEVRGMVGLTEEMLKEEEK